MEKTGAFEIPFSSHIIVFCCECFPEIYGFRFISTCFSALSVSTSCDSMNPTVI